MESKEENLPYETVVIKTKLKEESTRKGKSLSIEVDTTKKTICNFKLQMVYYRSLDFFSLVPLSPSILYNVLVFCSWFKIVNQELILCNVKSKNLIR
jgi:hypothetical protein